MTVSVVIPAYNAATWIQATLESVVHQRFPLANIELIVVDDASRDDSAQIAHTFIDQHSLIGQVISCPRNVGVSAARNVGWRQATGEWVQFLDSDDLLAPHKLELQIVATEGIADDVAVVYSSWQHFRFLDHVWQPAGPSVEPYVDHDPIPQILLDFLFGYVGPTLVRKSFLAEVGGFREQLDLGEDIDLMLRLAMRGGRFRRVESPEPMFFYRDAPDSLSRHALTRVESMGNLVHVFRDVDLFLRQHDELSKLARRGLVWRYSKCLPFFVEQDRKRFDETLEWIAALGHPACPPGTRRSMRLASGVLGYSNVLRLRSSYRRQTKQLGRSE